MMPWNQHYVHYIQADRKNFFKNEYNWISRNMILNNEIKIMILLKINKKGILNDFSAT